jgi:hypothetical protein
VSSTPHRFQGVNSMLAQELNPPPSAYQELHHLGVKKDLLWKSRWIPRPAVRECARGQEGGYTLVMSQTTGRKSAICVWGEEGGEGGSLVMPQYSGSKSAICRCMCLYVCEEGWGQTLVMSQTTGKKSAIGTPKPTRCCCRASRRSRRRATATTLNPARASSRHTAQPIPAEAPVTNATFPLHLPPLAIFTSYSPPLFPGTAASSFVGLIPEIPDG